jgi:glycosyltransferase involved in cell wall biosynthesis
MPEVDLRAIFFSDFSAQGYHDKEFGQAVTWDVPMLEGFRYEILHHAETPQEAFTFTQPRVPQLERLLTRENFDLVVIQGWNHYGYLRAAWLAKRAGLKVLLRCEATDHVAGSTGIKRLARELLLHWLFRQVDCFAAIGEHNRHFYLARGIAPARIVGMPYCVDNNHFREKAARSDPAALRSELGISDDNPVLLYASKLTRRKYADLLLEAYVALPQPRPWLVIVGDGELRSSLEARVSELSLARVRFAGFRNQGELPAFYALADVFVLPSVNETWGLVVNEAMNAGCAIVVTDQVGCARDLVKDGDNGWVIPPRDPPALSHALAAAIDGARFKSMGARSLERISSWGVRENIDGLRAGIRLALDCP